MTKTIKTSLGRPKTLVLIRHGESEANFYLNKVIKGEIFNFPPELTKLRDWDIKLTERGQKQAYKTGQYLKNNFGLFDACFISPQRRAVETFEEILKGYKDETIIKNFRDKARQDSRLREKDHGAISYLTPEEIRRFFPHEHERREKEGKLPYRSLGGESWYDVKDLRVGSFLNTIYRDHPGESILVIGHSITISCFRMKLERLSEEQVLKFIETESLENCGIVVFESDVACGGKLVLRDWNKIVY